MLKTVLTIAAILIADNASAQECISHTTREGAVYGEANYIGEPWLYQWTVNREWNNDRGQWVNIDPVTNTLAVPGEAIKFHFDDGSEFTYGASLNYHTKGDNLYTIHHHGYAGDAGPYQAIRTANGEVYMLDEDRCEPVSWDLAR